MHPVALSADTHPPAPGVDAAVAVKRVGRAQNHAAFIYRSAESLRQLHLAWHRDLRDESLPARSGYYWACFGLDELNLAFVAAFLSRVREVAKSVPYGIDWENAHDCIGPDGSVVLLPLGKGLTCATFVAAVMNAMGYRVVDHATWPHRASDEDWQSRVIRDLGEDYPEHADAMEADIGAKRLRPEEVVGACACDTWPAQFEDASQMAERILEDMNGA